MKPILKYHTQLCNYLTKARNALETCPTSSPAKFYVSGREQLHSIKR